MDRRTRLMVAVQLLAVGCSTVPQKPVLDQKMFDGLNRSGRTVREIATVDVSQAKLKDVVTSYAVEVSLGQDKAASPLERDFTSLHAAALKAYRDSLTVWQLRTALGVNDIVAGSNHTGDVWRIVDDYHLSGTEGIGGFSFPATEAIQRIWKIAGTKLDAADEIYLGRQ